MSSPELIANSPTPGSSTPIATLATAVITTPVAGTIETWTFSSAPPAALQAAGQYRFTVDSEICIDVTGGAGASRQIQRGAEGSTVATHLQGAGIYHGITAGGLLAWLLVNTPASEPKGTTGPGGVAGANTGSSITIPSPSSIPFDVYYGVLNSASVTVTMPDPAANAGVTFTLLLIQDVTGGRVFSFVSPPSFELDGAPLDVVTTAQGVNIVRCTSDGLAWHLIPDTAGPPTLDEADQARYNLHVPALRHVQAAATSNQTLSGLPVIDGYQTIAGDRVLLTAQSTGSQNGVWEAQSGVWIRPYDYPSGGVIVTRLVQVAGGGNAGLWACPGTSSVTIDTSSTTWVQLTPATSYGAKVASAANVASRSGLPVVDGYQTVAGDRILLTAQSTASQNGLWVAASGAWTRPSDYASGSLIGQKLVLVTSGTANSGLWGSANLAGAQVDTTSTSWSVAGGGSGVSTFNTRTGAVTLSKADVTGTGLAAADISAVDASDSRLVSAPMIGAASGRAQTISRVGTTSAGTALGAAGATNTLALGLFTAREALVVASLEFMLTSVFANAGDTVRLGLYTLTQPDTLNMTATLVARTDQTGNSPAFSSQRAAGGSGSTLGTINLPLSVTGGYPSTYTLTVGTRYMIGFLPIFSSGTPKFGTQTTFKVGADMAPYLGGTVAAQSDAPTAINAVGGAAPAFVGSTSVLYWLAASSIV